MTEVRGYFGANAQVQGPYSADLQGYEQPMSIGGWLESAERYVYDQDNRLTYQWSGRRSSLDIPWQGYVTPEEQNYQHTELGVVPGRSDVTYTTFNAAGLNTAYSYYGESVGWARHIFTTTYEGWDGYQERQVAGSSNNPDYKATTNTLTYDGYGRLREQREKTVGAAIADRSRVYANTYEGAVQSRRDGTRNTGNGTFEQVTPPNGAPKPNYLYVHAGGQQQAELKEGGSIRTSNGGSYSPAQLQGLNGTGNYAAGGGKVTVLAGETLQGLAQRIYGSAQLWYVLADANGLSVPGVQGG